MRADPGTCHDDGEQGSAVVEFVLVSVLIVVLLLAVLQVAVYVHVRNVVTASAQEGARYAANADVDSALGAGRTVEVVARATSEQTAAGLTLHVGRGGRPERSDAGGRALHGVSAVAARRPRQPAAAGGHRPGGQGGGAVTWLRRRLAERRGSALVEFVFVALVVFVPLVYIVAGFSAVQRGVFASTAAAREAGRAIGTAPDPVTGQERALRAAQLAVEDQSVEATDVRLAYAAGRRGLRGCRRATRRR